MYADYSYVTNVCWLHVYCHYLCCLSSFVYLFACPLVVPLCTTWPCGLVWSFPWLSNCLPPAPGWSGLIDCAPPLFKLSSLHALCQIVLVVLSVSTVGTLSCKFWPLFPLLDSACYCEDFCCGLLNCPTGWRFLLSTLNFNSERLLLLWNFLCGVFLDYFTETSERFLRTAVFWILYVDFLDYYFTLELLSFVGFLWILWNKNSKGNCNWVFLSVL